jgi:hypothetical protein
MATIWVKERRRAAAIATAGPEVSIDENGIGQNYLSFMSGS